MRALAWLRWEPQLVAGSKAGLAGGAVALAVSCGAEFSLALGARTFARSLIHLAATDRHELLMTHSRLQVRFDEKSIDKIFRDLDTCHLPGAAVGISIGGRPVYRKGFGLASMELPVTLTPQTRMRIYSMTKHFTCLAYLLICEEGKARIDDPIGKYLPELHPVTHRVTMQQLMSNTSGLRDACDIRWFFSGLERTVLASDLLALYREIQDVNFYPGEAWCYNNGGFQILSAIIEKLADQPLEEVFRKRIFEPAGMHDSVLRRVDTDFIPNSATMHMVAAGRRYERKYLPGELLGEGGIVSTVDDILRWLRHMAKPVVGDATTWALLSATQTLRDGSETGYGLGLFRRDYRGLATISHSGGALGNSSEMIRMPDADLDVVVMVNRHDANATELAADILSACFSVPSEPPRPKMSRVSGAFRSPATGRVIHFYLRNGTQMALIDGMDEWPLELGDDQVLRPIRAPFSNIALRLHGDTSQPDSIHQEYFGRVDELLPVITDPAADQESISGNFLADSIGVQMTVVADATEGLATTEGRFGSRTYRLERLCERLWRMSSTDATGWGAILATYPDTTAVTMRTPRTWSVSFRRG